jgi:DNA-binding transcriptional LysR family regulator
VVRLAEFHIADDLASGRLVEVLPEHQDHTKEPIYVVYPSRRNLSPRVRAFCTCLETQVRTMPWNG